MARELQLGGKQGTDRRPTKGGRSHQHPIPLGTHGLKGGKGMHQYKCDSCGASLDPGERCDCSTEKQNAPDQAKKKEEETCKKTA